MAIPPTRALVQVIGAHKPFKTSMCIEQTISLMKMFKVEFPEVTKMNIKNTMYFKDGGFRHFTANRLPSIKYYNQHIEFAVQKPRDTYGAPSKCGIEITFADGTTTFVDGAGKRSHQFVSELIQTAKGTQVEKVVRPLPPTLPEPIFFRAEGGEGVNDILPKFGFAPFVFEEVAKSRKRR